MDVAEVVDVAECLPRPDVLAKEHSELELALVPLLGKPELSPTSRDEGRRIVQYCTIVVQHRPVNCTIPSCVSSSPCGVGRSHFECEQTGSYPALAAQTGRTESVLE